MESEKMKTSYNVAPLNLSVACYLSLLPPFEKSSEMINNCILSNEKLRLSQFGVI